MIAPLKQEIKEEGIMPYHFDEIIDRRGTYALNTDGFRGYIFHAGPEKTFPFADEEFVRMWVADMEFATAPEICQAIRDRVDRRIFGYTKMCNDSYYEAFVQWCRTMYEWSFPKEELVFSQGVIPALYELAEDIVKDTEKILMTTPAYGFFQHAADYAGRTCLYSPLVCENGRFTIDFEDLERKASDPHMKLLIWCHPHNPTGRMWTEEELTRVAAIVRRYNLWVISDEIHCDLLRSGNTHTPLAKIMPDYPKLITCMSASKTFNMAGLMLSNIIIRDEALRMHFAARDKNVGFLNPLSIAAHMAAYREGGPWLAALKAYLDENFRFVKQFAETHWPEITFEIPDATYLAWMDVRPYLENVENIPEFFANEAGVLLEGGDDLFVGNAKGFIRLNLAMPRSIIAEGLKRMDKAMKAHREAACGR